MKGTRQRKRESGRDIASEYANSSHEDANSQIWQTSALDICLATPGVSVFVSKPSLATPCAFPPQTFLEVMENLVENPNITSSHLFRADIFYDSDKDSSFTPQAWSSEAKGSPRNHHEDMCLPDDLSQKLSLSTPTDSISNFVKHMRQELRPKQIHIKGFELRKIVVRKMIPRNPNLDRSLVQTCCFFRSIDKSRKPRNSSGASEEGTGAYHGSTYSETNLVVYLPHVQTAEEMPWYHPALRAVVFCHEWGHQNANIDMENISPCKNKPIPSQNSSQSSLNTTDASFGELSIHVLPFQDSDASSKTFTQDSRLNRTLKNLLFTVSKHGLGLLAGYKKHSNHDQIVPRANLQDTFTRLKQKYAKRILHEYWKESTDSTKGVFEDLGIAAFLIELWEQMYSLPTNTASGPPNENLVLAVSDVRDDRTRINDIGEKLDGEPSMENQNTKAMNPSSKPPFPGFVDIGCGNGILTFILLSEGFTGFGFDARDRKTWKAFPDHIQRDLKRMVLLPAVLDDERQVSNTTSNLTYLSGDSVRSKNMSYKIENSTTQMHNGLFAPGTFIISNHADELTPWTPLLAYLSSCPFISIPCCSHDLTGARYRYPAPFLNQHGSKDSSTTKVSSTRSANEAIEDKDGPRMDKRPMPSAYATLTAFVAHLTNDVGNKVEKEMLRIPSTRNACIIGRYRQDDDVPGQIMENRYHKIRGIIERETEKSISQVKELWRLRADEVLNCKDNQGSH